ncbi:MAG: DUF4276 family protein [Mariprofundus sp.]
MSDYIEIVALVEGDTEKKFISALIAPYLAGKHVYMTPIVLSKPGQKGGDVKFSRAINDIGSHLKQRSDTYLTLFVDYYGIRNDWPGLAEAKQQSLPEKKSETFNQATKAKVIELFADYRPDRRFVPYVAMHEFEALLFSHPQILADQLHVDVSVIEEILTECGEPEKINDSPHTAPSKRISALSTRFKKTSTGIATARAIGLDCMRRACPLFNDWLNAIERLPKQ